MNDILDFLVCYVDFQQVYLSLSAKTDLRQKQEYQLEEV